MSQIWINENRIKKIDLINIPGGISPKEVKKAYPKADVICTMQMFDQNTNLNFIRVKNEGIPDGYRGSLKGYGIRGDKDIVWMSWKDAYADPTIRDFVSGFPALGENRQVRIDWGDGYNGSAYVKLPHKRVIIGRHIGGLIFCATDNAMLLETAGNLMINQFSCMDAIAGDGGMWSPHLQKHDTILRQGYRKNPTWMLVYLDKLLEFIDIVYSLIGCDYIWGADGQIFTPGLLRKFINDLGIGHYITSKYNATKNAANNIRDFDCSGLFVYVLRVLGLISQTQDYTAAGLYEICTPKIRTTLANGDLVFRGNPINHVGMYYNGRVVNAQGTATGVVLSNDINTFTRYGKLNLLRAA